MSYEIPQAIAYNEKIAFGLTLKQLCISIAFLLMTSALIFKTSLPVGLSWTLGALLLGVGVLFIFFDLDTKIREFWSWLLIGKVELNEKNIKHFLGITSFSDDYVIVNKKKTAVIEVFPTNFSIKNKDERESIIKVFRKLLQAIDFPTQYYVKTEHLSVEKYVSYLTERVQELKEETENNIFQEHLENLKKHLYDIIKEHKIVNRQFYIIIPEQQGLEIQVKIIEEKITNLGLKSRKVAGVELRKLVLSILSSTSQKRILENKRGHLKVGEQFYRVITAFGYPRVVEPGFLDKIITTEGDFDISIHITPQPIETMMVQLNKELQKQRADLYSEQLRGIINPSLEIQHSDTRKVLEELQKGQDKLFDVSLYVNCRAETLQELNLLTKKVESELNSVLIIPKIYHYKQIAGIKSIAPIGTNILDIKRNIPAAALSAFFPFTSRFLEVDQTGVWFGLNKNNIPLIIDPFKFSNPNGVVLATSGAGKSYLSKLLISRQLLTGCQVIIIDPQGEYTDLVKKYHGQVIDLHTKSETIINPLDLMGKSYEDKRLTLMDLMKVMFGELSPHQKSIIDKAIDMAYTDKKISDNPHSWKRTPPKLEDVLRHIRKLKNQANEVTEYGIFALENKLEIYVTGVFKFLNKQTKISANNQLISFNIQKLPAQVQPVMMFLILDFVYTTMQRELNRKILLIDEAWKLLSRVEDANYILAIVKTCRKYNMGLLLINQEVEDLLQSQAGKSVLANSSYTLLLKQKPSVIKELVKTFDLSNYERDFLLTANIGEGILITEKDHSEIKILASPEEHEFITTNADERLEQQNRTQSSAEQKLRD